MGANNIGGWFDERKEWSARKHLILNDYLDPAAKIMGSIRQIYYVDGFAGRGTYGEGENLIEGSPVLAARMAQRFETEGKSYTFKCINVEVSRANYSNLCEVTEQFGARVRNLRGTFIGKIDLILQEIRGCPAVFFLDPFGVKGIDWNAVEKVIRRDEPTDLWIRFDHSIVRRLDGFYGSPDPKSQSKFAVLCALYGIDDATALHERLSGITAQERIDAAVELYREQLAKVFHRHKRSGFGADCQIKSLEGQNKYSMLFGTAHSKGAILASYVVYKLEHVYAEKVQEYRQNQTHQLTLIGIEPAEGDLFRPIVDEVKEDIWSKYRGHKVKRVDIHIEMLSKWFGRIKGSHITAALKELAAENPPRITSASGPVSNEHTQFTFRP